MKKKFILFPLVAALICIVLSSYHTGPATAIGEDACGASATNGCFCHQIPPSPIILIALELDDVSTGLPATTYIPSHDYTIKIMGTQTLAADSLPNFGFQVAVVHLAGAGTSSATNAGTLTAPSGPYHLATGTTGGASISIVEHADYLTPVSGTGRAGTSYVVSGIPWHSPAAGTGTVKICGVINAVNHNGSPDSGDHWNQGNAVICEQVAAITGSGTVCLSATTTLSDATTGGTWTSGSTGVATVTSGGVVSGVSGGTATISYNAGCSGIETKTVTVLVTPAITGTLTVCQGSNTSLTDPAGIGTWTSGATGIATANLITGQVGGVVTGSTSPATAPITFTSATTTCTTTSTVTVNPLPANITGTFTVCQGATTTLSDATTGGTWSSGSTGVATVGTSGIVTGVLTGSASPATSVITYTSPLGCTKTTTVTVNPLPVPIGGTFTACPNTTTALSDATGGGTWSSSNTGVATVNSSGLVFCLPPGNTTVTIFYIVNGCPASAIVSINPLPPAITGTMGICAGTTTTLSNTSGGGTWASSNTTVATIGSLSGLVTGGASPGGTTTITYTTTFGCQTTAIVTVSPAPSAITGTLTACPATTTLLSNTTGGGTWSSSNLTVASVGSSGLVTGGSTPGGTATITYNAGGCPVSAIVTINPSPAVITGTTNICPGNTTTLNDATTSGTWNSSNTTVASIGVSSGFVTAGTTPGGTTIITYTAPLTGCTSVLSFTVNPTPGAITGTTSLCAGATTSLSDPLTGGTWGSSNTTIASVGLSSGTVTGGANPGGNAIITYTSPAGCTTTRTVTVNPLPATITGIMNLCPGTTTTLSSLTGGGTWSSGNTTIASVGLSSGLVTGGVSPGGNTTITYTAGGCSTSATVTVNPSPSAITGITSVCVGLTTTLGDPTGGGTWTSSNTAAATVVPGTGVVSGAAPGVTTITYTLSTGCTATTNVTVSALPSSIGGSLTVCAGQVTNLTNTTGGGTWSSSNTALATAGLSTGVVTGVAPGTLTITYTVGAGCTASATVTVNPLSPITGATSVCNGLSATLADATGGGTWSSGDAGVATILSSGVYTGAGPGVSTITYTLSTGCAATTVVTVVSAPSPITGNLNVCIGATTALSDAGGGTWSSGNPAVATVVAATGVVTGVTTNTVTVTYSLGSGCNATAIVTVNPLPAVITGTFRTCIAATTTLADVTAGGTWSSNNLAVATVGSSSGIVTGVSASTDLITYTSIVGCTRTATVTVNPLPLAIAGTMSVCIGATTTLTDATGGGTWTSGGTGTATVTAGGIVTGVTAGTAPIIYTVTLTGCTATAIVTVNSLPPAITGPSIVCIGSTITLSDAVSGGTWSSSATGTATVGASTGIVSGLAAASATISYSLGAGCTVSKVITVNSSPSAIAGPSAVCLGSTISLSDATSGGTWSSTTPGVATIGATGIVFPVSAGTDTVIYTSSAGCTKTKVVTVNPLPASITGSTGLCLGATTTLSDATIGGTWSSGTTSVATIDITSGFVVSITTGTTNITYTLSTGCKTSIPVTVNPLPSVITGSTSVCTGSTITLSDVSSGGTWSSSDLGTATVTSGGVVTGVASGTVIISYTKSGCSRTALITVNASPAAITGTTSVCPGATTPLADPTGGGTWSSSSPAIASVGSSSGLVTGGATGGSAVIITYRTSNSCTATTLLSVNPLPAVITGTANVCLGATTTLSDATAGGTWSSASTGIASVGTADGIVTGATVGTTAIIYTLGTGCSRSVTVTVNPVPVAITGTATVCEGATTTLSDLSGGGSWSSGSTSLATVNATTGAVLGLSAGTATISYSLISGCRVTTVVTVNLTPAAITGTTHVCAGATTTLSDVTAGGSWSSGATGIATVGSASGIVSGISASTATISYSLTTGCLSTTVVTVNPLPLPITGSTSVCTGTNTTLADPLGGGTWSSSSAGTATIGVSSGIVGGVAAGTANIVYTLPTGCLISTTITVNTAPSAIAGTGALCTNATTTLSNSVTGGTWSSSAATIATVNSGSGVVSGLTAGTTVITYTLASGCKAVTLVTVNASPAAITGTAHVCAGAATTLSDLTTGGTWSSAATAIASVDLITGDVTGGNPGNAAIAYTASNGCTATIAVTVNPQPDAISGNSTVCVGGITSLTDATSGGTWSSSNTSIATVNSTGIVSGVAEGSATISYTLPAGCFSTITVSDNCNVGVNQVALKSASVELLPNPNNGEFTLIALLGTSTNEQVFAEITDMIGKVVYRNTFRVQNGKINVQITLNNNLANGMYFLNLRSENENTVLRFVKEK